MQLTPRYHGPPVLRFASGDETPLTAVLRQGRRLLHTASSLTANQWAAASRCEGWSVGDVISHLVTTNGFWTYSLSEGLKGEPSSLLSSFDPVRTPDLLVVAGREQSREEVLAQFATSVEVWGTQLSELSAPQWDLVVEAPQGHVSVREIAAHSLWDSWIHERDIAIPLGLSLIVESDEVAWSVKYVAGLGPAFLATHGSTRDGRINFSLSDPDLTFTVEVGAQVLIRERRDDDPAPLVVGNAVDVLESLSCRKEPLRIGEQDQWMIEGLAEVFEART
jgi:uncharacterized protein (TIGR03083 family)